MCARETDHYGLDVCDRTHTPIPHHLRHELRDRSGIGVPLPTMDLKTVDGLMKYVRRGFRISADPFRLADHDCGEEVIDSPKTGYCPHKLRSTVDEEVFQHRRNYGMVPRRMAVQRRRQGGDDLTTCNIAKT